MVDTDADATATTAAEADGDAVVLDVADQEAVAVCAADIRLRHGPVDALVNNAGIWRYAPLEEVDPAIARQVLDVERPGSLVVRAGRGGRCRPGRRS